MGLVFVIVAGLAAAICLLRLLLLKREIRGLTKLVRRYNDGETAAKLTMGIPDRDLEALAVEINRHTDLIVRANAERGRTEEELRQAVANISHDLRTPLTSIFGYIQMLDSRDLSAQERDEAIGVIRKRTLRLQALLNDFYELAMIDSTDYTLKPSKLRLDKLLPDILMGFHDEMAEKGLAPSFELDMRSITVLADESAVRRVVENLVVNAIRHARGTLGVRLEVRSDAAIFTLSNEAPQLSGTDTELLFNRFYMADASRSGVASGLGLSIARGLMSKMGGLLTAEMNGHTLRLICKWKLL
ncbi:sensor histidine kinase [Cohnella rhizosphaerae]|uniref:histidine kinase n=1 Tax=Cohnella rhizosphaerae TaxID=1457232 RepID=A0A9X4KWM5_9BACL|nr:HAMP domain-containing sensor histidine kinase [Cohnella rhizosphaerae]MDG0812616.1 HAMP domain-containing histidine kinase [Cohnella rhizosphaerae]